MCWNPIRKKRKKRHILRQIARLPRRSVLNAQDETDILLLPVLRATWGQKGEPVPVPISGRNARRVVFGALNLRTGRRILEVRDHQRQEDFQLFLDVLRWHYRGWPLALLLDEDSSHTAQASQSLAEDLDIELIWLPNRTPKLNPLDHLWGHAKESVSANKQRETVDEHAERFVLHVEGLSNREALRQAGVFSEGFWLKSVL